jgi:uncharacterized protein (TIGR03435 family)
MTSDERELKRLVARRLPSHMEFVVARDRVLNELRAAPPHLQRARLADPPPAVSWLRTALPLAAAAALIAIVATVSFRQGDWLATVEAADGSKYTLEPNEVMRASTASGAMLTLVDGSRVEMRAESELSLDRAEDGLDIRLRGGDIIVNAAAQRDGHLYVHTKDVTVAVDGTVFLVNAGTDGSRVGVIEGEVRVREGDVETRLRPGEQVATSPTIARRPLTEDITWSRNANAHLAILDSFMKGIAQTAGTLAPVASLRQTGGVAGQAVRAEFEEASIRQCDPDDLPEAPAGARGGGANSFQMTPGRTHVLCMTLATIIREAYGYGPADFNPGGRGRGLGRLNAVYALGVEDGRRVRGGPDWVRTERYTIEAVADETASAATMGGPMLQALFERRFGLKMHIETEQIPTYTLTVAEGGLKMKRGPCTQPPPDAPTVPPSMERVRRNVAAVRRGEATDGPCGFTGGPNGPNMLYVGAGAGMPGLSGILGAPVSNQTGIPPVTDVTGGFNYVLEFAPDDRTPGVKGRIDPTESSNAPRAPDIFTALEQQLGLKLQPARTPREFIVIDHIERPTAN